MANLISSDGNIQQADYFNLGHPQIVRNSAGHLYAGMINADRELEIHISTNAGVNWAEDTTLSYSNVTSFNLAITDRGDVLCAVNSQGADVALQMRNYDTGAWSEIRTATYRDRCIVRFDDLNDKICFYAFDSTSPTKIKLHYSTNYGSSFTASGVAYVTGEKLNDAMVTEDGKHYLISTNTGFGQLYVMQLDADFTTGFDRISLTTAYNLYKFGTLLPVGNDCWVAYWNYSSGTGYYQLYTRIVHPDGSVTDKGVAINWTTTNTPIEILSMLKDGNDNIYLLYSKQSDKNAYYVKYDNLAGTWGSETQITTTNQGRFISSELNIPGDVSTANLTYFKTS
jgi:hypothetical protein